MAANNNKHQHKPGGVHQSNKKQKRSLASKRSQSRRAGGRCRISIKKKRSQQQQEQNSKANRLHQAQQQRKKKRQALLSIKRQRNGSKEGSGVAAVVVPRVIGLISLSEKENELEDAVRQYLIEGAAAKKSTNKNNEDKVTGSSSNSSSAVTVKFDGHGPEGHMTLLTNVDAFRPHYVNENDDISASVMGALDLCRVCDGILFLLDGDSQTSSSSSIGMLEPPPSSIGGSTQSLSSSASASASFSSAQQRQQYDGIVSHRGDSILAALKAQGLPTSTTLLVRSSQQQQQQDDDNNDDDDNMSLQSTRSVKSQRRSDLRRMMELKRFVSRFASTELGADHSRVMELDLNESQHPNDDDNDENNSSNPIQMDISTTTDDNNSQTTTQTTMTPKQMLIQQMMQQQRQKSHIHHPTRTALIRMLSISSMSPPKWISESPRPYLLTTTSSSSSNNNNNNNKYHSYNEQTKELSLTGYIRGGTTSKQGVVPWDIDGLIHVPGLGTFNCARVTTTTKTPTPTPTAKHHNNNNHPHNIEEEEEDNIVVVLGTSDKERREDPSNLFAIPNALDGEQNLIGFDSNETEHDNNNNNNDDGSTGGKVPRPAGWSDYQAAWLDGMDEYNDDEDVVDHGELAKELNQKKSKQDDDNDNENDINDNNNDDDVPLIDMEDANDISESEKHHLQQQQTTTNNNNNSSSKRSTEYTQDLSFPDEVELPRTVLARERFARYRALKNVRKSYWDPKEQLPLDYNSIYHFANYKATKNDVWSEMDHVAKLCQKYSWDGKRWIFETKNSKDKDNNKDKMMTTTTTTATTTTDKMMDNKDADTNVVMEEEEEGHDEEDDNNSDDDNDDNNSDADILHNCIPYGTHVTIVLSNVPASSYTKISPLGLVVAVGLLPHEHCASVLHMGISHHHQQQQEPSFKEQSSSSSIIKSKDVVTVRCGWRTWDCRPLFSQHNLNSDKHKLERFMPTAATTSTGVGVGGGGRQYHHHHRRGAHCIMSAYGPVTYGPCPVLVFHRKNNSNNLRPLQKEEMMMNENTMKQQQKQQQQLVAVGSMVDADANRIIMKRIVLTGFPVKVRKRTAVVKYMFYNPDDVKWFQPAGLTTKHGLQGNITESVGDHGTMKCLFNAPIKQHDTVCLALYKRVYPKFAPKEKNDDANPNLIIL